VGLRSTEDALAVVRAALGSGSRRVVVLPLDAHHHGVQALCVDHVPHDDAVLEVVDVALDAHLRSSGAMAALVVASRRTGGLGWPSADDWWRYGAMVERCALVGVTLLDWFLVGDHGSVSMAELDSQPESRWEVP
jgi:DNA repair protein RadC